MAEFLDYFSKLDPRSQWALSAAVALGLMVTVNIVRRLIRALQNPPNIQLNGNLLLRFPQWNRIVFSMKHKLKSTPELSTKNQTQRPILTDFQYPQERMIVEESAPNGLPVPQKRLFPRIPLELEMKMLAIKESKMKIAMLRKEEYGFSSSGSDQSVSPETVQEGLAVQGRFSTELNSQLDDITDNSITPQPSINSAALIAHSQQLTERTLTGAVEVDSMTNNERMWSKEDVYERRQGFSPVRFLGSQGDNGHMTSRGKPSNYFTNRQDTFTELDRQQTFYNNQSSDYSNVTQRRTSPRLKGIFRPNSNFNSFAHLTNTNDGELRGNDDLFDSSMQRSTFEYQGHENPFDSYVAQCQDDFSQRHNTESYPPNDAYTDGFSYQNEFYEGQVENDEDHQNFDSNQGELGKGCRKRKGKGMTNTPLLVPERRSERLRKPNLNNSFHYY